MELLPNLFSGRVASPRGRMRMSVHFRYSVIYGLKEQTATCMTLEKGRSNSMLLWSNFNHCQLRHLPDADS